MVANYAMQEEGWVVCRAFKKPTPNHRQGYEAWHHAYYVRDHNNHVRLPSSMDLLVTENHMMNNNNNPNINEAASSTFHHRFDHNNSVQEFVSNHIFSDTQLMNELPKLDSPSSISATLATNNESLRQNTTTNGISEEFEDERSNNSSQYIDWKNLDSLLVSQLSDATTSFAQFSNLPSSITENYSEKENYNQHLLGCFPDL
ncbi:hypothetical protein FEM48_Zijuj06G0177000 [Ziziphus jujuba var. spinosa]|uniref:NAC domain-containing protein n=1 Tax=Ziziphus jujuba var. spinosa TaxID=714518 RepID=A0A978VAP7_ZIZJJ|nr:hypothetical protein FEM48_Zijuj06G0177000 [Ziziphus jujuba var. spinosa]